MGMLIFMLQLPNVALSHLEFLWFKYDVLQPQLSRCVMYNFPGVLQLSIGMHNNYSFANLPLICCSDNCSRCKQRFLTLVI